MDQTVSSGGGYQQSINAIKLVNKLPSKYFETVFLTNKKENIDVLKKFEINIELIKLSKYSLIQTFLRRKIKDIYIFKLIKKFFKYSPFEKLLKKLEVDIIYFLSPTNWAFDLSEINYIYTVWDLAHRDFPEFPEVRKDKIFESREDKFNKVLPKAISVIVDSDLGKNNLVKRYGIDKKRIYVLPFEANSSINENIETGFRKIINISEKYKLNHPYIFYPAQFWPHKNHVYILEGLKIMEEKYKLKLCAIFSGGDKGNKNYIVEVAEKINIIDRIIFPGFVEDDELIELYLQAEALVMPTYFGPTNLPPLEAFKLGVPVLYSNVEGLRDQVDESALLIDLNNPESMADQLFTLLNQPELKKRLITSGKKRIEYFNSFKRDEILLEILSDFRTKRKCWK